MERVMYRDTYGISPTVEQPEYMKDVMGKPSLAIDMMTEYSVFKEFMLSGEAERLITRQKAALA